MPHSEWVLLSYRLPREPSTPRIALWRRLRRLGVAQVSDGLVALPRDARTSEQLEWAAEHVTEHGGTAGLWAARPWSAEEEGVLVRDMTAQRAAEYREVASSAAEAGRLPTADRRRTLVGLRRTFQEITRRDYFPPAERDVAASALQELEVRVSAAQDADAVAALATGGTP